ncbi:MAG: glucuronate isomerase [Lachnospiraceae bacterium]|nr:glucuronate isomerase [Lachnospiraceae bacterium]
MSEFMNRDFLLTTAAARTLYHEYAAPQPIFDYHNHLSPRDIAEHRRFTNLTELWLSTDHYKWRAMRAQGIDERLITGDSTDRETFDAWAYTVPRLVGSPLYHWVHLELQRYFGIEEVLTPESAGRIWKQTEEQMLGEGFDAVSLLNKMNVRVLCTTDDPRDDLAFHRQIRSDASIPFEVRPSFRPDAILFGDPAATAQLCAKYRTLDVKKALADSMEFFRESGCLVSDHGFGSFPYGEDARMSDLLRFLGRSYAENGMVMQLHLGAIRNTVPHLWKAVGRDSGADSIGVVTDPNALAAFLGDLDREYALPRTILYNHNPADNRMLANLAVCFAPNVQFGAAWWMNDHLSGIDAQIGELMESSALASSVGMLTDSRSFTSFVRHEYFRRILCRKIGALVEEGQYPADFAFLGALVEDLCYRNAARFIGREE